MDVARLVGTTLARLGVGRAFGVVGSGNFALTNALRAQGVPFVATRHEAGAATMADAYARMSGRVAIVTTHQGCGFTNALTGIGEAAKSRTPLIVLAADTANGAVRSNFRIDQDAAARAVGAVAERVYSAQTALDDTVRAYTTALRERRTVVLNLPLDVQVQQADEPGEVRPPEPIGAIRPDASAVSALADALARARRPVFVAGRGARKAAAQLRAVAERAGALLATSAVANGLFRDEPWSLGISGGFASPLAAELISGADLIVGWGCALNMWTMRHGKLIGPGATVVQVDIEQSALGADRPIDLGVLGDVGQTATDLHAELTRRGRHSTGYRDDAIGKRIAAEVRWRDVPYDDLSTTERIDPRTLSARLDELLPAERVVAIDSGNFMGYPSAYLSVPDAHGFCFTQAFQSIGLGLATAIGAALAQPDRLPVAAVGDGGFLMNIAEMDTLVRLGLPMVVVVYNDSAYGAEVHHFTESTEDELASVRFPETDIAAIGRGFGATGITVRTQDDLAAVRDWLAGDRGTPLVIDAKIADDGGAWWLAEAFHQH
ncbi:MAG TPA: thiamine pyrophosphate-binding protein [Pseudonocardiaceae bacterium]|jgi:thiamine pyrophosphate-dependent acetolactate synthase large subunit-like protein|nr:thiamine pyrophosphate-binding protein [Pseudonocardiaceae bacterium]